MTSGQRAVLFWVFVALFAALGVVSLLVAINVIKAADPLFRKVAIGTFLTGVAVDGFAILRTAFAKRMPLSVIFEFKENQDDPEPLIELKAEGNYELWDSQHQKAVPKGRLLVQQNNQGWWYCDLPDDVGIDDRVRIILSERNGSPWKVPFFSFGNVTQRAKRSDSQ